MNGRWNQRSRSERLSSGWALTISGAVFLSACGRPSESQPTTVDEINKLRAEVAALNIQVGTLSKKVDARETPPPTQADRQRAAKAFADAVEGKYAAQAINEMRLGEIKGTVEKAIARAGDGNHLQALVCRGTSCRLEVKHDTEAAYQRFTHVALLDADAEWRGPFELVKFDRAAGTTGGVSLTYLETPSTPSPPPPLVSAPSPAEIKKRP